MIDIIHQLVNASVQEGFEKKVYFYGDGIFFKIQSFPLFHSFSLLSLLLSLLKVNDFE